MPQRQRARFVVQVLAQPNPFDLARGLGQQARLFGPVQAPGGRQHAAMAAQVRADGHVFQHAHAAQQAHVLERAGQAQPRDLARARAGHGLAQQRHLPRRGRVHPRDLVEHRALARAIGADQRQDFARAYLQVHGVVGDQAAELARHVHRLQHHLAARRHGFARQRLGIHVQAAHGLLHADPARQQRPQAAARAVQQQHHAEAEHDDFKIARLAQHLGQPVLQPLLGHREHARAHQRAPDLARAADDGHEQVFDAHLQAEGVGVHETLHVGVQPARRAGLQRRDDEDHHARTRRVHAHGFRHHAPALERTDGAAFA
ncbi:hypothetical protein D3C86_1268840 [compost metagenome]